MWPFTERRSNKRYAVEWEAEVYCFPFGQAEYLEARVIEVATKGARILLHRMHLRTYHLMVNNNPDELILVIHVPDGAIRSKIIIRWYNRPENEQLFTVGVEFYDMPAGGQDLLEAAISGLKSRKGMKSTWKSKR